MINNNTNVSILAYAFFFAFVLFSCKHKQGEYHSLIDKIKEEGKNYKDTLISSENYLNDIKTIEITEGDHTFLIPERKSQIKLYACTECHIKPVHQLQDTTIKKAHWDIELAHASANTMNCITCHKEEDMNSLQSITGTTVDFNKSYQLCSQCHTKQFEDWKGGAHGKRIGGWVSPRSSMTCVNCHNPHKPQFESRWPATFNTQKAKERE